MKRFIIALMMTGIAGVAFADDDPVHFEPGQKGFGFITEHGTEAGAEEQESSEMDGEPMQGMPADDHLPDAPPANPSIRVNPEVDDDSETEKTD